MKEKIKTFFCILFLACALPYIITVSLQGKDTREKQEQGEDLSTANLEADTKDPEAETQDPEADTKDPKTDVQDSGVDSETPKDLDIEEYLVGVVAAEIPLNYETEALKAQAVLARTNLMAAMEQKEELPQSISQEELLDRWKEAGYSQNYQRAAKAVEATRGVVITYQGSYPYAAFHAVSAGSTRNAQEALGEEMPWLTGVDSTIDIPSENYLKVTFFEKKDFAGKLKEIFDVEAEEENPLDGLEITARDAAEYVTEVAFKDTTVTGEEFRNALELPSACLYLKEVEGKIRIVTKGLGHGLGMSQYGANAMAQGGSGYQEILNYYFKNIEISD